MLREQQFSERRLKDFVDALDREAVSRFCYVSVFLSVFIPDSLCISLSINLLSLSVFYPKESFNVDLSCPIMELQYRVYNNSWS